MKIQAKMLILYISIFLLIFSTDTFIVFANRDESIKRCFQFCLLLLLFFLILKVKKMLVEKIITYMFLVFTIALSMLLNNDFSGGSIIKIFLLTLGLFLTSLISFDDFAIAYINIIFMIALISLPLYLCTAVIIRHADWFHVIKNIGETSVAFFGLSNVCLVIEGIPRNYGPFWEPGVYATYLNMALLFSLKAGKRISFKEIIFILGVFSTLSTAGIIILFFIMFDYIYLQKKYANGCRQVKKSSLILRILFVILAIAMLIFMLSNDDIRTMVFAKFNKNDFRFMSTSARLTSITGNISIWLSHPFFGVGANNVENEYISFLANHGYSPNSNTNGLLIHYSMYGFIMGSTVIYCLYKFSEKLRKNALSIFMVFTIILMMLAAEPLIVSALFNTILFYGFSDEGQILRMK